MKKRMWMITWILLTAFLVIGCGRKTNNTHADAHETNEPMAVSSIEFEQLSLEKVMDRIAEEYALNNALNYENKIEDMSKDAVVMLCQSESGKYTAYGIISPEYGQTGIMIDYIINGESNLNYFDEFAWTYGDSKPTLSEQDEHSVIFTFTQGNGLEKTIDFDTFETGTMSIKE